MLRRLRVRCANSSLARVGVWGAVVGFAALALAAAGNLDTTYGTSGIVESLGQVGRPTALAGQSDGKALLGGARASGQSQTWRVERFLADGTPDTAYGTSGAVTLFGAGSGEELKDMAIDAADRCVAVGVSNVAKGHGFTATLTVVRLTTAGSLDTNFGSSGVVKLSTSSATLSPQNSALAIQGDGKVVVTSAATVTAKGKSTPATFVARLAANGSLDASFGSGGITIDSRASAGMSVFAVALQSSGHVVVGGRSGSTGCVVTRFLSNGSTDNGFGVVTSASENLEGMAVDVADRIVVTGNRSAGTNNGSPALEGVIVRYDANGALDTSFGTSGRTIVSTYESQALETSAVFTAAGGIVVGMSADVTAGAGGETHDGTAAVRFLDDGQLDTSYGAGGVGTIVSLAGSGGFTWPVWTHGAATASDGSTLIGGRAANSGVVPLRWFIAKYQAN